MPWLIIGIAFLLAPLGCWALLARTKILGLAFAIVSMLYGVAVAGGVLLTLIAIKVGDGS
jgi:hypothetical protein